MDCAEACPLPDQEGCHPMKHCQPPWRRQSEPEIIIGISSAICARRTRGGFLVLDQRLFRDGDLLCGKRAVRSVPEKSGQTEAFMADRCM